MVAAYGWFEGDTLLLDKDYFFKNTGKKTNYNYHLQDAFIICKNTAGKLLWSKHIWSDSRVYLMDCQMNSQGDLVFGGYVHNDSMYIGDRLVTTAGNPFSFVGKLDKNGVIEWVKTIEKAETLNCLDLDDAGNVVFSGSFDYKGAILEGDTLFSPASGTHDNDIYLGMLHGDGSKKWWQRIGGNGSEGIIDIEMDRSSSSIYLGGSFISRFIALGHDTLYNPYSHGHSFDGNLFLLKLDFDGRLKAATQSNCFNSEHVRAIDIDRYGNLLVAGDFNGYYISIGSDTLVNSVANTNIFVAKFTPALQLLWMKGFNTDGAVSVNYILANQNAEGAWLTGSFGGHFIDMDTRLLNYRQGARDGFLLKMNDDGDFLWSKQLMGHSNEMPASINLIDDSTLFWSGTFQSDTLFTDNPIAVNTTDYGPWHFLNGFLTTVSLPEPSQHDPKNDCGEMTIQPNPILEGQTVSLTTQFPIEELKINDSLGRAILTAQPEAVLHDGEKYLLTLPPLPKGGYYISCLNRQCGWLTKKLIIQ